MGYSCTLVSSKLLNERRCEKTSVRSFPKQDVQSKKMVRGLKLYLNVILFPLSCLFVVLCISLFGFKVRAGFGF